MVSPNNRYVVVFNGEIYNHQSLRKQLPDYCYRGHSDTETITHALEVWGIRKTVEALDGMFALGIYDQESKQLTLARDFAGIKPLFFGFKSGAVVFGSQYDQLLAHPLFRDATIDPSVLKLYLQQHFLPAPFGLHIGMHQVRPGEIVTFSTDGSLQKYRYWELPTDTTDFITDESAAVQHVENALSASVSDQLVADVPLGAFLSGGVDSPLVCALAKRKVADLQVFSIGSDSKVHDESERATAFATALDVNQHLWKLNADEMLAHWEAATKALHEPLADFSILPTYLVSKLAKQHVTVALSGDGGDELFFGYERFWSVANNLAFQHLPQLLRNGIYGWHKYVTKSKRINGLLTLPTQAKAHESLHCRFPDFLLNEIAPDLKDVALPAEWDVYNYPNSKDLRQLMQHMRKAEFYGMMQKTLRKVDLASMANSLEVRVPFLQKSFIEASLQVDPLLTIKNGGRKVLLHQLLQKAVPAVSTDIQKKGFSIPLSDWMRGDLGQEIKSKALQCDFIAPKALNQLYQEHHTRQTDAKWPLFTLFALQQSLKKPQIV